MKNRLAFLAILFLFVLQGQYSLAQTFKPYFEFGAKAGVSLSRVYFDPKIEQEWHQAISTGLALSYYSEPGLGVSIELNTVEKGWEESSDQAQYSRTLRYVEVPLLTRINFGGKHAKMLIELGPYMAFYQGGSVVWNVAEGTTPRSYYLKPVKYTTEYGLGFGMGVVVPINRFRIQLNVRGMQAINGFFETTDRTFNFAQNQYISFGFTLFYSANRTEPTKAPTE